jgi:hypothetical protein
MFTGNKMNKGYSPTGLIVIATGIALIVFNDAYYMMDLLGIVIAIIGTYIVGKSIGKL